MRRSESLLLLPGALCNATLFEAQINYFADQYNVSVGDFGKYDSIGAMAKQVLANAPEYFALAGLSMGGIVAFEIMRQAPERVQCLALLDTNYRAESSENATRRQQEIATVKQGGMTALLKLTESYYYPKYLSPAHIADKTLKNTILEMAKASGAEALIYQWQALMQRADYSHLLAKITCPTLVLCGEQDALCGEELHRTMADIIPTSTLEIIPNCGHLSTMEAPDSVNQALARWLQQ